jgi:acyl carrier protein
MDPRVDVRAFFENLLAVRQDFKPFSDSTSFFLSGRLSSVDAVELVVFLEEKFGIDFAETGFDQSLIDSVDAEASRCASGRRRSFHGRCFGSM